MKSIILTVLLRVQKFIFQKSKLHFSFFLLLSVFISCQHSEIWNVPEVEFISRIRHGDREFLRHLDYENLKLKEINKLGSGSGYYMSYVYESIGMRELCIAMLNLESKKSGNPWSLLSRKRLISFLLDIKYYKEAEKHILRIIKLDPESFEMNRSLVRALYRQGKYKEVLKGVQKLRGIDSAGFEEDLDLSLYEAVSLSRLKKKGWRDLFSDIFLKKKTSKIHYRAYTYLLQEDLYREFDEIERSWFKAKSCTADAKYGSAVEIIDTLYKVPVKAFFTQRNIWDLYRIYIGSGRVSSGAEKIENAAKIMLERNPERKDLYMAMLDTSGRLYRRAKRYDKAMELLREALKYSIDKSEYDRILWYYLDSSITNSPEDAVGELIRYSKIWNDPEYFYDLFDRICSFLVENQSWNKLYELYNAVKRDLSGILFERYSFVAACMIKDNLVAYNGDRKRKVNLIYKEILESNSSDYYRIIVSCITGKEIKIVEKRRVVGKSKNTLDKIVSGFLDYGLLIQAYNLAYDGLKDLSPYMIRNVCYSLMKDGRYLESINLIRNAVNTPDFDLKREDYLILFPEAFRKEIRAAAENEGISVPVLFALVREESRFEPEISSRKGAAGLTQLMPATARETAWKMGIKDPVLDDPIINLSIGARYLNDLYKRFGNISLALSAYNSGPSNLRRWQKEYNELSKILFIEAIPFVETRNYVKKVLVSAVYYGYLYEDKKNDEVVKIFLPNL